MTEDFERCYRAVQSRDARFDGWFFTAVTSTHVYCRPSCPALTPKRKNVRFYPTAAAAQQSGFRACLRCRPDASPGSPEWLGRQDAAARAMRLLLDGIVDREGVSGLANRLGYSERQLNRLLVAEIGTGALALARAQRAQTARLLLETTDLPTAQVAFGAGFKSVRQFNDTIKEVFARTPSELRRAGFTANGDEVGPESRPSAVGQAVGLRLAYREPLAAGPLFEFLGSRAVAGLEAFDGSIYRRTLRLAHGEVQVQLSPAPGCVRAVFTLGDVRDLTTAVARCRHLLNLDADPVAVDDALGSDPFLRPLVERSPGLRVAGSTDGFETAVRAIVGQQVSVTAARKATARLVRAAGNRLAESCLPLTHSFPSPEALATLGGSDPKVWAMPESRRRAVTTLAEAVARGELSVDPGSNPDELTTGLMKIPGIGPWTASYIAMRALGDPDAFLPTDLGLRRAVVRLGRPCDARSLTAMAKGWRPWRAYALVHLWSAATGSQDETGDSAA